MLSNPNIKIAFALIFASVLIAGALFIKDNQLQKASIKKDDITVITKIPPREPIETLDKNKDGVPDWQEALLVTNALDLASSSQEYAQPETLTEQFALEFFQDMVRSKNYGAFGDTSDEIALNASEALAKKAVDTLLTIQDIKVSTDDSLEALIQYGQTIAEITTRYNVESNENEALILERALKTQDQDVLKALDNKIEVYTSILKDTLSTPVPAPLQQEHLNLVNSYQAILTDIKAMRTTFTDPMLTLLRMKRYKDDATGLAMSFIDIYTKLQAGGATWDKTSPVYLFIKAD